MGFFLHNGQPVHTSFLRDIVDAPAVALKVIDDNFWYLVSPVDEGAPGQSEKQIHQTNNTNHSQDDGDDLPEGLRRRYKVHQPEEEPQDQSGHEDLDYEGEQPATRDGTEERSHDAGSCSRQ